MQIKRRNTLGILFSLLLIVGAAASFTAPRSHALEAAQDNSKVTSTNRHTACKRRCEEKYSSCVESKKAKGWSDDRAEKTCGLAGRTCNGSCDRR
jgi:hypothetical protein